MIQGYFPPEFVSGLIQAAAAIIAAIIIARWSKK